MEHVQHVIAGESVASASGETFGSVNPWTRQEWATVSLAGRPEVDAAVEAAREAFDHGPWPRMTPAERGAIMHRVADLVEAHTAELARLDTLDMGMPISNSSTTDVASAVRNFRFFADHARLTPSYTYPNGDGLHQYARFDPAGVVVCIAPWNYPLNLGSWKVAPALAWGNCVVLKPAEQTPASATRLAQLALEAGLPPGVLNVVHGFGPDQAGEWLTRSDRIDRITFTGESATGSAIAAAAAARLVPVSLECGGKGANLVFDDANLDVAIAASARGIFNNSGQVCLVGSRIYVQRSVHQRFLDGLVAAAQALPHGDPMDPVTRIGPLASEEHFAKVSDYLASVPADGGRLLCGGPVEDTWIVRPTVAVDLPADARVCRQEVFGPLVVVTPFDDEDEAVHLANDTPYGLSAMLHTRDLSRAHRLAGRLRAGTVWVNTFGVREPRAPFGGFGISGVGREGGDFSREFFTEPKTTIVNLEA